MSSLLSAENSVTRKGAQVCVCVRANSRGCRFIYISMRNAAALIVSHLFNWQLFLSRRAKEGKGLVTAHRLSLSHTLTLSAHFGCARAAAFFIFVSYVNDYCRWRQTLVFRTHKVAGRGGTLPRPPAHSEELSAVGHLPLPFPLYVCEYVYLYRVKQNNVFTHQEKKNLSKYFYSTFTQTWRDWSKLPL